ncbi:hypothetical protein KEJ21_06290 [Candidatus Bathyarchaeota archaeon]|nr:hypothetical protein [Candidatus Bathyarchaeota archaeon]
MGSFGSVFALAIVGMVIIISFGSLAKVITSYEIFISEARQDPCSKPSIISGYITNSTTCFVNITLNGSRSIPISKIQLTDVFVAYRSVEGTIFTRLEYGPGWSIIRILTGAHEGELVNPINLMKRTGLWDPGETLELKLFLPSPSVSSEWYFLIVLPDGGSCSWIFLNCITG